MTDHGFYMLGLMGTKLGMTETFTGDGDFVPVTAVELGPCIVVQCKTAETDGYNAIQLGYGVVRAGLLQKPRRFHFEKRGLKTYRQLREFRVCNVSAFNVGEELCVAGFKVGEKVHVRGISKGRGFQGVMKRHGKHGGPASHGSDFHRRPGSIGMRTWPGHVLKNMKMPGHMGCDTITVKNLKVVAVRPKDNVLLVKGAIPGATGGLVVVTAVDSTFESRPELKKVTAIKTGEGKEK